jgi:TRAP-type C4-dicarboxylate transport system substrate-binding protein
MRGRAAPAVALAAVVAGCGGSGGDKAGGREETLEKPVAPVGKPVTLTLVTVDVAQSGWVSEFAAAAARLSGGAIRIEIRGGGYAIVDYERRLVERVRAGEADLASVGARAWDRMDATSFRALVAPSLVDTLELQRRVLESPLVERMLAGVEPLDLVGLAILPGPLRRPLGLSRQLLGPQDYAGATIGIRYGGVARDTITALGATAKGYRIGSLAGLDGAELDLWTIAGVGYDAPGATLTANVVLWPRPETIVISRAAFDRLSPAQQEVLRRAGREAVGPVAARVEREQAESLEVVCGRGTLTLATASPSELAALRVAVQPVYDELERDPETKGLIAEIRKLRTGEAAQGDAGRCPSARAPSSALEGVWEASVTPTEIRAHGGSKAEAATFAGAGRLELRDGRWTFRNDRTTVMGTYRVAGDVVALTMRTCTANPCDPGMVTEYGWSVYRDELTLTTRPGELYWPRLVAKPTHRVE